MKKYFCFFIIFCMTLSLFTLTAIAETETSNYDVIFSVNNYNSGATVNVEVKNLGSVDITDWLISWKFDNDIKIVNSWCANIVQSDQEIEVTSKSWNKSVPANGSIYFGFSTNSQFKIPEYIITSPNIISNNEEDPEVLLDVDSKVIDGNKEFAFDMFKKLSNDERGKNLFYSPLSISTALTMLYQGAEGQTKKELAETLKYSGIDLDILNNSYKSLLYNLENVDKAVDVNISNSMWIDEGFTPNEDFIDINSKIFDSNVSTLDLQSEESTNIINNWISESTNGLIDNMISYPVPDDIIMYLINAIYFKGGWTEPFNPDLTNVRNFTADNGTINSVDMMHSVNAKEYVVGDGYSAVKMPFGEEKISMYCILPDVNTKIDTFISEMNVEKFDNIRKNLSKVYNLHVYLPKFKMEYGVKELNDILIDMGMVNSFTDKANFTGIADNVYVNSASHKAIIEVDEEGAEAAAVTVISPGTTSMPITFNANRPFVYLIVDDTNDSILFMGKASDLTN